MTWSSFTPKGRRGGRAPSDRVRVLANGTIVLSMDLVARLGSTRVALLTNTDPAAFGIRAFSDPKGEQAYQLHHYSTSTTGKLIQTRALLRQLRRRPDRAGDLAHAWDGDVLVVDVSSLPRTGEG